MSYPNFSEVAFDSAAYDVHRNEGRITISVKRIGASNEEATVDYQTSDGSATLTDYVPASGTLRFSAGEVSRSFEVEIRPKFLSPDIKTVALTLERPSNCLLVDPSRAELSIHPRLGGAQWLKQRMATRAFNHAFVALLLVFLTVSVA